MYRMPTHFGPSSGPRQGKDGRRFDCRDTPKSTTRSVSFLTNHEQLDRLLPEGFQVGKEPVVTVSFTVMTEIEWLAGRGYNTLGVSFPAIFSGVRDRATGSFLTVLWENLADPIITGREELGFSKIYCELPEPRVCQGETHCIASWMGFKFMDLWIRNLDRPPIDDSPRPGVETDGTLHFKYMPRTGEWGSADAAYAVLTPADTPNRVVQERWIGEGTVQFHKTTWEDLPTMFHIVNAFHDLEILEYRGASVVKTVGGKDLSDQRILE
jgi:hypothetical protein